MEGILEKYLGDIKSAIPINRIVVFLVAFLVSVISHDEVKGGLYRELLFVKLSKLSFDSDGLFAGALVGDALFAILLTLVSWVFYVCCTKVFIKWLWARLDLQKFVDSTYKSYDLRGVSAELSSVALEYSKQESQRRLSLVRRFNSIAELFVGFGVIFLLFCMYTGAMDLILSIIFLVLGASSQIAAILLYLKNVLPYELHASALSGIKLKVGVPQ